LGRKEGFLSGGWTTEKKGDVCKKKDLVPVLEGEAENGT